MRSLPASIFDQWAISYVEEIVNVRRDVWDSIARWRFINYLIEERILDIRYEADGTILLLEAEEKTSTSEPQTEVFSSAQSA